MLQGPSYPIEPLNALKKKLDNFFLKKRKKNCPKISLIFFRAFIFFLFILKVLPLIRQHLQNGPSVCFYPSQVHALHALTSKPSVGKANTYKIGLRVF